MANYFGLLALVAGAVVLAAPSPAAALAGVREFDYFALALQWPGTICERTRHCCPSNGCCRSESLTWFTIHGLWPDYDDGTWPSCCRHADFDVEKISSLMPKLEKYWPSLYCSSSSTCFGKKSSLWAHEWEKHGTCSYPVIQDEYSYFSSVLELHNKYNITGMLESYGIFANNGKKYALREIADAIKRAFGASPMLVCKHGSIEELRLCFSKDFKPRDCGYKATVDSNGMLGLGSSCPRNVRFPTYDHLALGKGKEAARPDAAMSS